jgi:hypothetical protein
MTSASTAMKRFAVLLAISAATLLATLAVVYATTATEADASARIGVKTDVGTAAPPPTLGRYTVRPFAPDSRPLYEIVTGVPAPGRGALRFDRDMVHYRVGAGWGTWSHGYTGDVYSNSQIAASPAIDEVVMRLPKSTKAFYFYVEPNEFATYDVEATGQDGTTSGPIATTGLSGARYFGFYAKDRRVNLTTVKVDVDSGAQGFAVGEFGIKRVTR